MAQNRMIAKSELMIAHISIANTDSMSSGQDRLSFRIISPKAVCLEKNRRSIERVGTLGRDAGVCALSDKFLDLCAGFTDRQMATARVAKSTGGGDVAWFI